MRLIAVSLVALALAGPASAALPRFAVYDIATDLSRASKNDFGDIRVAASRSTLARRAPGAAVVRCGSDCRFGSGWLAFGGGSHLEARDVRSASAHASRLGSTVTLHLSARGAAAWSALERAALARQKRNGVPDVFAIVLNGTIYALPYGTGVRQTGASVELSGFTRAGARAAAQLFG
jgi:hypothetical protein